MGQMWPTRHLHLIQDAIFLMPWPLSPHLTSYVIFGMGQVETWLLRGD